MSEQMTFFGPSRQGKRSPRFTAEEEVLWSPLPRDAVLLALDPSITNCGWAILQGAPNPRRVNSGIIRPIRRLTVERHDRLFELLRDSVIRKYEPRPTHAAIEMPRGGGRGGKQMQEYLRAVGICEAVCFSEGLAMNRIHVNEWKSNEKKQPTMVFVKHYFSYVPRDDNEADALGLGLWLCGRTL